MAHFIKETLCVDSDTHKDGMILFGMEDKSKFYIANEKEDAEAIYLSFTFKDWTAIKNFIDEQFRKNHIPY